MTTLNIIDARLVEVVSAELQAESDFKAIAYALDIDAQMPGGFGYRNFTTAYKKFAADNPTPLMLLQASDHGRTFIAANQYEGDKATSAMVYVLWKVWQAKASASGGILRAEIKARWDEMQRARDERTALHIAVSRICKNKPDDTFEAGLKANVVGMLETAGATSLAGLAKPDVGKLL